MFEIGAFFAANIGLTMGFTAKLRSVLGGFGSSKAGGYIVSAVMSALVPAVISFGGESLLELLGPIFGGGPVNIPTPDLGFPAAGYVLTSVVNFFAAGGFYDLRKNQ